MKLLYAVLFCVMLCSCVPAEETARMHFNSCVINCTASYSTCKKMITDAESTCKQDMQGCADTCYVRYKKLLEKELQ